MGTELFRIITCAGSAKTDADGTLGVKRTWVLTGVAEVARTHEIEISANIMRRRIKITR